MSLRRAFGHVVSVAQLAAMVVGLACCAQTSAPPPMIVASETNAVTTVAVPRTVATEHPAGQPLRRATPGDKRKQAVVEGTLGLFVGQPIEAAEQIVGGTVNHISHADEEAAWSSSGYQTDEEPIFALGFDVVSEFSQPKLPIYKIYASRGLVRVIKISAYVVDASTLERRVGFEPSCFLLGPPEAAVETFGAATYVEEVPDRGRVVYHFVDAGLSVLAEDGRLQVFDVFGSLGPAEERRVRDALSKKSARTRS